jgi:hypothetical protein
MHSSGGITHLAKKILKFAILFLVAFLFLFWIFNGLKTQSDSKNESESKVISRAFSKVRESLKDPSSADFGQVVMRSIGGGNSVACGTVNAKNGFGGYSGFKRFIYTHERSSVAFDDGGANFSDSWDSLCR